MTLRSEAFATLSRMVPDMVLLRLRHGAHPLQAWAEYRGMTVFDVAAKAYPGATGAARDAFATKLNRHIADNRQLSPGLVQVCAKALDIPDTFLINSFYEEFGINV